MKRFAWLSIITTALTFPLIGLGAIVRLKGAGLACPDWPLCYGKVTPLHEVVSPAPAGVGIALEVGHRYLAGLVGLLVLSLLIWAWVKWRRYPGITLWATIAMCLLIPQAVLGGLTVLYKLAPPTVSLHLLFGNIFFGSLIVLSLRAIEARRAVPKRVELSTGVLALVVTTLVLVFGQIFLGGWVAASGAAQACSGFPACTPDGAWLTGSDLATLHMVHRGFGVVVAAALVGLAAVALRSKTMTVPMRIAAVVAGVLVIAQIFIGWFNVLNDVPVPTSALHTAIAAVIAACVVFVTAAAISVVSRATRNAAVGTRSARKNNESSGGMVTARAYLELAKPGIIRLLLILTFCSMLVAAGGVPAWDVILWTLLGMALISASANAVNMVYDRDIDAIMKRTRGRPLPTGRLTVKQALGFSLVTGVVALVILGALVNMLTMLVALGGHLFYVLIYTMWLKRATPQNIVIGGAAGSVPPLVGWAAVTGSLDVAAWIMFLIVFLWTPPHFWALSLYKQADYKSANVPMLPVARGARTTKLQIIWYTVLLIPTTLALGFMDNVGVVYLVCATILGAAFCYCAIRIAFSSDHRWARRTFAYSIVYLGLLFGAMSLDSTVFQPVENPGQNMVFEKVEAAPAPEVGVSTP